VLVYPRFGSKSLKEGVEGAEYITPLVFMIVLEQFCRETQRHVYS
jgi:hypothetical protein